MNNPLNRSMFRQAGMSKQPMGILASSPELMTTAQKAMMNNQPIRAENGVTTRFNPSKYVNIQNSINDPKSILNQKKKSMEKDASIISSPISKIGNSIANVFKGKTEAEIAASKKIEDSQLPPIKANSINEYITKAFERQKIIDKKNEELNPNYKAPFKESDIINSEGSVTVDSGETITKKGEIIDKDGTETKVGTELIEPPKKRPDDLDTTFKEDLKNINTIDKRLEDKNNKVDDFNILNNIDKTIKNDKDTNDIKANKIDKILGIEGLKNKIKARELILDEIMGSAGSDVRTDANYVMMMTGLLIASGQDPNALSNIAQGAAKGLSMYGEAQGKDLAEKRKVKLVAAKLGFQAQASEDAKKSAAGAATLKFGRDIMLQQIKSGLGRDKSILGLVKSFASNQNLVYMSGYQEAVKANNVEGFLTDLATNIHDSVTKDTKNQTEKTSTEIKTVDTAGKILDNTDFSVSLSKNNELNIPIPPNSNVFMVENTNGEKSLRNSKTGLALTLKSIEGFLQSNGGKIPPNFFGLSSTG
tara:strand:+ start:363 stop:1961 length:1599 start_codon:yes stop_codon:yes gene_type:complete